MTDDEDFGLVTEEQAQEAEETLMRYSDEYNKIMETAERILSHDIPDREHHLKCVEEVLENAYYDVEKDLKQRIMEYENRAQREHERLERMGL